MRQGQLPRFDGGSSRTLPPRREGAAGGQTATGERKEREEQQQERKRTEERKARRTSCSAAWSGNVGLSLVPSACALSTAFIQSFIKIASDNYPETILKTYCINSPWIFR